MINVLAQGHNAVMLVRLEPAAPLSRVKHFTIESLCSQYSVLCTVESLPLLYLFFYLDVMFYEMMHNLIRGISCKPNIYVS